MTPQSQRTPVPTLTPVVNPSSRKDQYDPTNVSHKQYFMPQSYPPASKTGSKSQTRSKSPISDNSASGAVGALDCSSIQKNTSQSNQLTPMATRTDADKSSQDEAVVRVGTSDPEVITAQIMESSAQQHTVNTVNTD